jgi:hypothetical protein
MRLFSPYRVAALLLVFFCAAHTGGGMLSQKSLGFAADSVFTAMKKVHFQFNGADATWYEFWFGFGITASVFLLLSAVISWQLDRVEPQHWAAVSVIAWALFAAHVINAIIGWAYFFAGPGLFGTAIAVLLAVGAARKRAAATGSAS